MPVGYAVFVVMPMLWQSWWVAAGARLRSGVITRRAGRHARLRPTLRDNPWWRYILWIVTTNTAVPGDFKLLAVIAAAEENRPCPRIRLLVGDWLVQGHPVSTETFLAITRDDMTKQVQEGGEWRRVKRDPDAAKQYVEERVGPLMAAFGVGPDDGATLNLRDAVLVNSVTLKVPAVRIPLTSIQAWWHVTMVVEESRRYSAGIAVGVGF